MLQQMRDWFGYLKWVLLVIVFMFVWWAFAAYSGGISGSRKDNAPWAALVNGTIIDVPEFQNAARRLDSNYQSLFGEQYAQQRGLLKVGRTTINSLVDEELLYQEAVRQGLRVSPAEVAQAITSDPNLQQGGAFIGVERYRQVLKNNGLSAETHEQQVRRSLLIEKYRELVGNAVSVSDAEVEKEFLRRNEKVSLDWILVDAAHAPEVPKPDDAALQTAYKAHPDRYMRGEGRSGLFVLVNPKDLSAVSAVSDADVKAAYDRDRDTRYTIKEQRRASHILFKVAAGATAAQTATIEAKARGVLKRVKAGEDFAALAKKYSEDSSAGGGGDLNFFGRGQMVKEFEEAAFSLPVGATSDLVRTTYGFHIIKVTDSHPARTTSFDEAKEGIRQELAMTRARGEVADRARSLAAAAAGGRLSEAAATLGLKAVETGPLRPGDALPGVVASQAAVTRLLALAPGQVSDAIALPAGQVVVQATQALPDEPRPFAEVRDKVEGDWLAERRRDVLAERSRSAATLDALARQLKTEVKHQDDLPQGSPLPGVPRDATLEQQIATLAPGAVGAPVATGAGIVVLTVRERKDHRDELASQKDSTRDALMTQGRDRLIRAVIQRLREHGDVRVNDAVVDSIDRG